MPIAWNSQLDTGIAAIDAQHQQIIGFINQLEAAQTSNNKLLTNEVIARLIGYTQSHFGFEEELLKQSGYAYFKPHQKVHELFARRVEEFTQRSAQGEDIASELREVLLTWLNNHITDEDLGYIETVKVWLGRVEAEGREEAGQQGLLNRLVSRFFA